MRSRLKLIGDMKRRLDGRSRRSIEMSITYSKPGRRAMVITVIVHRMSKRTGNISTSTPLRRVHFPPLHHSCNMASQLHRNAMTQQDAQSRNLRTTTSLPAPPAAPSASHPTSASRATHTKATFKAEPPRQQVQPFPQKKKSKYTSNPEVPLLQFHQY